MLEDTLNTATKINEIAPHSAVLFIRVEIHELLPTGELKGSSVYNIGERNKEKIIRINGTNYEECLAKLNTVMETLNAK